MKVKDLAATAATHDSAIETQPQRSEQDTNQSGPTHLKPTDLRRQAFGFPAPEELMRRWWELKPEHREKEFWTPGRFAKHTRYSESRIRGMCDEGSLPFIKIWGRIQIHVASVVDFWVRMQN